MHGTVLLTRKLTNTCVQLACINYYPARWLCTLANYSRGILRASRLASLPVSGLAASCACHTCIKSSVLACSSLRSSSESSSLSCIVQRIFVSVVHREANLRLSCIAHRIFVSVTQRTFVSVMHLQAANPHREMSLTLRQTCNQSRKGLILPRDYEHIITTVYIYSSLDFTS